MDCRQQETTRRRKIPQVLIPRPRDPDRYDFLATCLRGIKIKRHWFGRGGGGKNWTREKYKTSILMTPVRVIFGVIFGVIFWIMRNKISRKIETI